MNFRIERHPLQVRHLRVESVHAISARMRRIRFAGDLSTFRSLAPEDHVKLLFPNEEGVLVVPRIESDRVLPPEGGGKPIKRDYTPMHFDEESITFDFLLHEGSGVASTWAENASAGDALAMIGPRGSKILARHFDTHVMIGDETALPEFERRLQEMKSSQRAFVFVQAHDEAEARALESDAELTIVWAFRDEEQQVIDRLRDFDCGPNDAFFWLAGEANEIAAIRRLLTKERGVELSNMHASGHWKRGVVEHDHHLPLASEA